MATQKSIADKLGLSISLVSRVLSGKAKEIGVAEETIKKVMDEAKRTNYTRNSAALSLRGDKTHTLGVVTYDFEDPYFGIILGELHKIAKERSFTLILAGSYQRDEDTMDLAAFAKHSIEGLIIVGSDRKKEWYEKFINKKIPSVQIGFTTDKIGANICLDESKTAKLMVDYLAEQQTQSVTLFFNHSLSHETFKQEHIKVLTKQDIEIIEDVICDGSDESVQSGVNNLKQLPNVIIAGDDIMATKIIRSLYEKGIQVPKDVKVFGFDNIMQAHTFIPSLTTVTPPIQEMVQKAFDLVSQAKPTKKTVKFVPELITRESA